MNDVARPSWWTRAYPLLLAVMVGGTLVDQMYFHAMRQTWAAKMYGTLISQVSDALLMLVLPVLVAGVVSVWRSAGRARALFAASLAVFSLEFLLPVVAGALVGPIDHASAWGPALRISILAGALLLAIVASHPAKPVVASAH